MRTNRYLLCLLTSLVLVAFMPSSDSLWVDEAQTWNHVAAPDIGIWLRNLLSDAYSEAFMPLGMFLAWIFGKVLGTTEWALRAPNLIWTALSTVAFWRIGLIWRTPCAPLIFAVQPFVWFYADEAHPYSLQIACIACLVVSIVEPLQSRNVRLRDLLILLGSSLALIGTTLFGIVTVAAVAVMYVWLAWQNRWRLPSKWPLWVGTAFALTLACGVYYCLGLQRGAAGAKLWNPSFSNVAFSLYEFGGFTGFGPGREELREIVRSGGVAGVLQALRPSAVPLAILTLFYLAVGAGLIAQWRRNQHRDLIITITGVLALVLLATTILAFVAKFPFWGRHLAPIFPFFVTLSILPLRRETTASSQPWSWIIAGAAGLLLLSSLQLRFAKRHRKDDYRNAAGVARVAVAQGKNVWWVADRQGGRYYGLDFESPDHKNTTSPVLVTHKNIEALTKGALPDLIILSKPDIYDESGAVRSLLASNFTVSERFKAFTIWRPKDTDGLLEAPK